MKYNNIPIAKRKRIALVAHDNRKAVLLEWVEKRKAILANHEIYTTGTTGKLLEERFGLKVNRFKSGPMGGDQQIGAKISEAEMDMLIFFWDPLQPQAHESDVRALLRIAVLWNIPCASNPASADFLLTSPLMDENYEREVIDYEDYMSRRIPNL